MRYWDDGEPLVQLRRLLLILGLLLCAIPAYAAAPVWNNGCIIQSVVTNPAKTTCTITIAAGHNVYVASYQAVASAITATFSDSSNTNTYTQITNPTIAGVAGLAVAALVNLPAQITTVSVSWSGTAACSCTLQVADVTGAITTGNGLDPNANAVVTATASATGTNLTSGNPTTTNANDLLINWTGEATTSSGWAVNSSGGNGFASPTGGTTTSIRLGASDKTAVSSGSQGTTSEVWTTTGTNRISALISVTSTASGAACSPELAALGAGCQ